MGPNLRSDPASLSGGRSLVVRTQQVERVAPTSCFGYALRASRCPVLGDSEDEGRGHFRANMHGASSLKPCLPVMTPLNGHDRRLWALRSLAPFHRKRPRADSRVPRPSLAAHGTPCNGSRREHRRSSRDQGCPQDRSRLTSAKAWERTVSSVWPCYRDSWSTSV
jgi:hypothetical protein